MNNDAQSATSYQRCRLFGRRFEDPRIAADEKQVVRNDCYESDMQETKG